MSLCHACDAPVLPGGHYCEACGATLQRRAGASPDTAPDTKPDTAPDTASDTHRARADADAGAPREGAARWPQDQVGAGSPPVTGPAARWIQSRRDREEARRVERETARLAREERLARLSAEVGQAAERRRAAQGVARRRRKTRWGRWIAAGLLAGGMGGGIVLVGTSRHEPVSRVQSAGPGECVVDVNRVARDLGWSTADGRRWASPSYEECRMSRLTGADGLAWDSVTVAHLPRRPNAYADRRALELAGATCSSRLVDGAPYVWCLAEPGVVGHSAAPAAAALIGDDTAYVQAIELHLGLDVRAPKSWASVGAADRERLALQVDALVRDVRAGNAARTFGGAGT